MPHDVLAFLVLQLGATLDTNDEGRLRAVVQSRLSSVAVPAKFVVVDVLPAARGADASSCS